MKTRLLLSAALLLTTALRAQESRPAGEVGAFAGPVVTHLLYNPVTFRIGGRGSGADYRLRHARPQLGATAGLSLYIPVPPSGQRTYILLRGGLAYLRRSVQVDTTPYGLGSKDKYTTQEHYRTLNARVLIGVRYFLNEQRSLLLEAGPMASLALRDNSWGRKRFIARPDSSFRTSTSNPLVGNVLLHLGLGYRRTQSPRPWSLIGSYSLGVFGAEGSGLRENYAELTLHYPLSRR